LYAVRATKAISAWFTPASVATSPLLMPTFAGVKEHPEFTLETAPGWNAAALDLHLTRETALA